MKSEGISRWRQVGEALMREIDQGLLGPGDKLPAEFDLAERFGVARQTVRRALSHLRNEGMIDVQLGRGTFVSDKVFQYRITARKTFEENLLDSAMSPSRDLLRIERAAATQGMANNLKIEPGSPLLFVLTVNKADGVPVVLGRIFFPLSRVPGLEDILAPIAAARRSFSLAAALAAAGVPDVRRNFIRLRSRLPSTEEAEALELPPLETIVETSSMSEDGAGNPVFYSLMSYRGSSVEFYVGREAFTGG